MTDDELREEYDALLHMSNTDVLSDEARSRMIYIETMIIGRWFCKAADAGTELADFPK